MKNDKIIKVSLIYNAFDPTKAEKHELVYRPRTMLKTYLHDLPTDCEWRIGLNGVPVDLSKDGNKRLRANDTIQLVVMPRGGGGGFKGILRIVAQIAIAVGAAALAVGGGPLGTLAAAALTVGGSLLVNAILPPATPKTDTSDTTSYGYDGAKNTAKSGIALPVVYGQYRVAGNYVDLYTQNLGDDQYLYGRTVLSDGKINSVSDLYINDQPVSNYTDFDYGFTLGETTEAVNGYFNKNTTQVNVGTKFIGSESAVNWINYTTTAEVEQITLDLLFPGGICHMSSKGKKKSRTVYFDAQISVTGLNEWTNLNSSHIEYVDGVLSGATPSTNKLFVTVDPVLSGTGYSVPYNYSIEYRLSGRSDWTVFKTIDAISASIAYTYDGTIDFTQADPVSISYTALINQQSFEWTVPQGAYEVRITGDGTMNKYGYRVVTGGGKLTYAYSGATTSTIRRTIETGILDRGIYDIRIRKTTNDGDNQYDIDEAYLSDVGEITNTPVTLSNVATGYYKIRMSEQLSGLPNCTWLVKGVEIRTYDIEGNVLTTEWSDNPAWIVLDMLIGDERGSPGIYSIDFPAFVEWAEYCETAGLTFNGVFDTTSTLWDACVSVLKIGHATFSRIGTKLSVAIDKPSDPVMLFGPGNIFKDSFKISYLAMTDRANEFEVSYYDKDDMNKQKTIRIVDPDAENRGDLPRAVSYSLLGIDNFEQAQKEAWYQLYNNRYLRRTVSFDAPIESIGLSIGDVAYIQHDMMNWGNSGRLAGGSTATVVNMDKPYAMETGNLYSMLVIHNSLTRATGTITGINGNTASISGFTDTTLTASKVKRIVQGSVDLEVIGVSYAGSTTFIDFNGSGLVTGPVSLADTDVIEERDVVLDTSNSATVTVSSAFSIAPQQYSNYMIGIKTINKKPYRFKAMTGTGFDQRTLTFIEYNEAIYGAPEQIVPQPATVVPYVVLQVAQVLYSYNLRTTDKNTTVDGVLSWKSGHIKKYAGADVYVGYNGSDPSLYKTVFNLSNCNIPCQLGDDITIKVVAFDTDMIRAASSIAPVLEQVIEAGTQLLPYPSSFVLVQTGYDTKGSVKATWVIPEDYTSADNLSYRVQVQYPSSTNWNDCGSTSQTYLQISNVPVGTSTFRLRTEQAAAYSAWETATLSVTDTGSVYGSISDQGDTIAAQQQLLQEQASYINTINQRLANANIP